MSRNLLYQLVAGLIALSCYASSTHALASEVDREYQIKAAYLFNITKFVKWNPETSGEPLRICIVGDNPFGDLLDQLNTRKVQGRPLAIEAKAAADDLTSCSVAFFTDAEKQKDTKFPSRQDLLTIGEGQDFVRNGGVIALNKSKNKIRLSINITNAKKSKLQLSANLLEIATVIE